MNCLVPSCKNEARWRGLCKYCGRAAARDVKAGRTTLEELYEAGLATPPKHQKGDAHPFRKALREARERRAEAVREASEVVPNEVTEKPRKRLVQKR